MDKKLYITLYISFLALFNISAQEFPLHTQYMYNKSAVNPGFVGVRGKIAFLLMHRSQWVKVEGAPTSSDFSFEYPLEKIGFGLGLNYQQFGPITKFTGNLQFSYNLELSYSTFLSLGVNGGIFQNQLDINKLKVKDLDEDLFSSDVNSIDFNVGIGAFLYTEDWYVGLSTPNLNMQKYYKNKLPQVDKRLLHAYLMGGYNFELNRKMTLQPSFLVRYVEALPFSAEVSMNLQWNETLTTGLAYRLDAAYSLLIGINVSRLFYIGYAFDWDQNKIYLENYGSHELFLRYFLTREENSLRFQSPRFF